jgi:hypothetical protein
MGVDVDVRQSLGNLTLKGGRVLPEPEAKDQVQDGGNQQQAAQENAQCKEVAEQCHT